MFKTIRKMLRLAQTSDTVGGVPNLGENTRGQSRSASTLNMVGGITIPGMGIPTGGDFAVYRAMRMNPTIALAREFARMPIEAATITFTNPSDKTVPDVQTKFIESVLKKQWPTFIYNALYALDYGFKPFEKIYEIERVNGVVRVVLKRLKPLRVDDTKIRVDKDTGRFEGVRNKSVDLGPEKCFVYTNDGEDDDCYGRSRHENIRKHAWKPWMETSFRLSQYITKAAGVIPMVRYTNGKYKDASGAKQDAHVLAQDILQNLGSAKGILFPMMIAPWAEDLLADGKANAADIDKLLSFQIDFLEVPPGHGTEMLDNLAHKEKLLARGWLVPERSIMEGHFGTKAEAGVHGNISIRVSQAVLNRIIVAFNERIVDPLLVLNYGPESAGNVIAEAQRLDDDTEQFIRDMIEKVLTQPSNIDLLMRLVDLNNAVEQTGLPQMETGSTFDDSELIKQGERINMRSDEIADDASVAAAMSTAIRRGLQLTLEQRRAGNGSE